MNVGKYLFLALIRMHHHLLMYFKKTTKAAFTLVQKRARQAEARHMRTYALIATDSCSKYVRGKLKRRPLTVCLQTKLSLKYRLQADSVRSASERTKAVFLSSVTRLHGYICLALAYLAHVFVLMWTQLNTLLLDIKFRNGAQRCDKNNMLCPRICKQSNNFTFFRLPFAINF